jgi:hypothetical protein
MSAESLLLRTSAVVGLAAAYLLSFQAFSKTEVFNVCCGSVSSPVFPWIQFLWWLPFAFAILLLLWRTVGTAPVVRALLLAVLFTPGLTGVYRVLWLVPAWYMFAVAALGRGMMGWVIVTSGVPFVLFWSVSATVLWVVRRSRKEGMRRLPNKGMQRMGAEGPRGLPPARS